MQFAITLGSGLEIEGQIIDQLFAQGRFEHGGGQAVGIELDLQPQILHGSEQGEQLRIEGRLAAGNHHSVDKRATLPKFFQERRQRIVGILFGVEHQGRIMTEGTAQVAAPEKDQGSDPPRKIEETRPLETFDLHVVNSWSWSPPRRIRCGP